MFQHFQSDQPGEPIKDEESRQVSCGEDPVSGLKAMFVDITMGRRIAGGQEPVQRPVFLKPHGVAHATFTVRPDLPDDLRTGVFQHERFDVWVRFSSDTVPSKPDFTTTVGIGIKLFRVPGEKLLEPELSAETHDFILQNHDVFFVDTAKDMCEFTYAGVVSGALEEYLNEHPTTRQILQDMKKEVPSLLDAKYWSVLPHAFGPNRYVKYKIEPAHEPVDQASDSSMEDPAYLHKELRARLQQREARFNFFVQFQTDPDSMPLDRATVRWDESESPHIHVATLTIPSQDIDSRGQAAYGENLAYNPWHALPEHSPVGSISEARKVVYQASSELRRNANGIPIAEPVEPRHFEGDPKPRDSKIVRAAIHPSIGIARVGSSEDEYFIGPEVTDPAPRPPGYYKDARGALKREAARFRIYGYNGAGEVVSELTADNADILWTVHVASKKAAWYQFQLALDIPEATSNSNLGPKPSLLRNSTEVDRKKLTIDPGPRSIRGRNKSGAEYSFDTGMFFGKEVYLGELRADELGRLVFLGGHGVAASSLGPDVKPADFANNDGWHDDVSDGPVKAEVSINGRPVPVDSAWVVVAPPNYAPQVKGGRTMYDLLYDTFVREGRLAPPSEVSFTRDVYPIFRRLSNLQWVNQGYSIQFGPGGRYDFADPQLIGRLADNSKEEAPTEFRLQIFNMFRDYDRDGQSPVPWPWEYGDAMNIPPASTSRQNLALAPTQYQMLRKWANGDFVSDWNPDAGPAPSTLDAVPVAERPAMLDRAALSFCLADAFHPGCEMTWVMRHGTLYESPFRIRHRTPNTAEPNYGSRLTQEMVLEPDGALHGQGPGTITRWMAVPWQTDTASCRSGYYAGFGPKYDPYLPTFWPARVPNHVLTEQDYEIVIDSTRPYDERVKAFGRRAVWLRGLGLNYREALAKMIHDFDKLGIVEVRPGVDGDPSLPEVMLVESTPAFAEEAPPLRGLMLLHLPQAALADEVTPSIAVSEAALATGLSEEDFVVGPIDKVKRFENPG
jgi:hypothetical protein